MPECMPSELTPKEVRLLYDKLESQNKVAEALGITRSQVRTLLGRSQDSSQDRVILPTFPDEDISAEEILDHMGRRFQQRLEREDALRWFSVRFTGMEPVGLTFVGDPHLGSNGCHVSLLRQDVDIMANTEGVVCVNLGDTVDGGGGYLIKLYAENDVSRETEKRLAKWFLQEAGIPWKVWLIGNHDTMGDFSSYLKAINAEQIPMIDWQARFKLVFPDKSEIKIDAAHNHKGTSIYNPLHGQKRAALWSGNADIYIAGHHHNWAITQEELEDGRVIHMARARGYKWLDTFAVTHGFNSKQYGASIMFVIDPQEEAPTRRIKSFADLSEGAKYLTWKRNQGSQS